jgi:Flp pilus assembly protein TadD
VETEVAEGRETRALVQIALEKMRRSQFAEAKHDLEGALRIDSRSPVVLSHYGLCLAQLGDDRRALECCETAVRLDPENVVVRVNLGKVHRLRGNNAAAHRSFVRAWEVDHRHVAPAAELARMGIRRPPVLRFLPRSNWCNRKLGQLRARLERSRSGRSTR